MTSTQFDNDYWYATELKDLVSAEPLLLVGLDS